MYVDYDDTEIYGKIFKYSLIYMTNFVLLCVGDALLFKDEEYIPQGNKNPLLDERGYPIALVQRRHPCRPAIAPPR